MAQAPAAAPQGAPVALQETGSRPCAATAAAVGAGITSGIASITPLVWDGNGDARHQMHRLMQKALEFSLHLVLKDREGWRREWSRADFGDRLIMEMFKAGVLKLAPDAGINKVMLARENRELVNMRVVAVALRDAKGDPAAQEANLKKALKDHSRTMKGWMSHIQGPPQQDRIQLQEPASCSAAAAAATAAAAAVRKLVADAMLPGETPPSKRLKTGQAKQSVCTKTMQNNSKVQQQGSAPPASLQRKGMQTGAVAADEMFGAGEEFVDLTLDNQDEDAPELGQEQIKQQRRQEEEILAYLMSDQWDDDANDGDLHDRHDYDHRQQHDDVIIVDDDDDGDHGRLEDSDEASGATANDEQPLPAAPAAETAAHSAHNSNQSQHLKPSCRLERQAPTAAGATAAGAVAATPSQPAAAEEASLSTDDLSIDEDPDSDPDDDVSDDEADGLVGDESGRQPKRPRCSEHSESVVTDDDADQAGDAEDAEDDNDAEDADDDAHTDPHHDDATDAEPSGHHRKELMTTYQQHSPAVAADDADEADYAEDAVDAGCAVDGDNANTADSIGNHGYYNDSDAQSYDVHDSQHMLNHHQQPHTAVAVAVAEPEAAQGITTAAASAQQQQRQAGYMQAAAGAAASSGVCAAATAANICTQRHGDAADRIVVDDATAATANGGQHQQAHDSDQSPCAMSEGLQHQPGHQPHAALHQDHQSQVSEDVVQCSPAEDTEQPQQQQQQQQEDARPEVPSCNQQHLQRTQQQTQDDHDALGSQYTFAQEQQQQQQQAHASVAAAVAVAPTAAASTQQQHGEASHMQAAAGAAADVDACTAGEGAVSVTQQHGGAAVGAVADGGVAAEAAAGAKEASGEGPEAVTDGQQEQAHEASHTPCVVSMKQHLHSQGGEGDVQISPAQSAEQPQRQQQEQARPVLPSCNPQQLPPMQQQTQSVLQDSAMHPTVASAASTGGALQTVSVLQHSATAIVPPATVLGGTGNADIHVARADTTTADTTTTVLTGTGSTMAASSSAATAAVSTAAAVTAGGSGPCDGSPARARPQPACSAAPAVATAHAAAAGTALARDTTAGLGAFSVAPVGLVNVNGQLCLVVAQRNPHFETDNSQQGLASCSNAHGATRPSAVPAAHQSARRQLLTGLISALTAVSDETIIAQRIAERLHQENGSISRVIDKVPAIAPHLYPVLAALGYAQNILQGHAAASAEVGATTTRYIIAADNMLRKQAAIDCSSTASAGGQSLAETSVEEHGQLGRLRALSTAVSQAALAELNIQQAIDDLLAELGKGSPYWPRVMPGLVQTLRSRASSAAETRLIGNGAEAAQQILNIADLYTQTTAAIK